MKIPANKKDQSEQFTKIFTKKMSMIQEFLRYRSMESFGYDNEQENSRKVRNSFDFSDNLLVAHHTGFPPKMRNKIP